MSCIYAAEVHLVRIECDEPGCNAFIKPHPEISRSGWSKKGVIWANGDQLEWYYCPAHRHTENDDG